jgi:uncharacterized protein YecT (DUF1311 family)
MPMDPGRDPWSGATYKGFSGGSPEPEPPPRTQAPRRPRGLPRRALVAGGVAVALLLGLALGFLARPELIGGGTPAPKAAPPTSLAPPGAAQVPIAMAPPAPAQPAPQPRGKLQTLPPELAAAERGAAHPQAASPAPEAAQRAAAQPGAAQPEAAQPEPQAAAELPVEPATPAISPAPPVRASFDCATARPGAEQLVCSDPDLAAQDRRLARAYRRALRSGVDPVDLRQEQRDWTAIREDAARRSRLAVAQIYDQRITELNRMADSAGVARDDADDDGGQ